MSGILTAVAGILPTAGGGGGGGIALVSHLEYSVTASNTTGALDTTGADLIVIFCGSYKDWQATSITDSQGNTWTALTNYAGSAQAGRFFYCFNPTTNAAHTFTPNFGFSLYQFVGVLAFSGATGGSYHSENGGIDTTDPLQPGSITPAVNASLIVSGIFNYGQGASPTVDSGLTYYGVAKSGSVGMGGHGWYVQPTATAINPTWTSSGAAGSENAVVIADFAPA